MGRLLANDPQETRAHRRDPRVYASVLGESLKRPGGVVGRVARWKGAAVGFVLWTRASRKSLLIVECAVEPGYRRLGVGSILVEDLLHRLCADQHCRCSCALHERNLVGQLFLRRLGFVCERTWPGSTRNVR